MSPYFIAFFILSFWALVSLDQNYKSYVKLNLIFALFFIAVMAGFRSSYVGADYESYKDIFYSFNGIFSGGLNQVLYGDYFFEPGFALLTVVISSFTSIHVVFLLVISLLTSLFMYFTISRLSLFPLLSLLVFFSYDFFTNYMVAIRFGLATALGLCVLLYLSEKRYKLAFGFIFVAMSIHTAAIGLFLPFLLSIIRFQRIYILFMVFMALIVGYIGLGSIIFNTIMPSWIPRANSAEFYLTDLKYGNSLGYLGYINVKYLILSILLYVFWDQLEKKVKHFKLIVIFLVSAMVIRVGFHDLGFISGRVSALLGIAEVMIVPALFLLLIKNKLLAFWGIILYAAIHLSFMLFVRGFSDYSTIFS
ncbi:MAG: EpsG family protein [Pseudomonadota bacterium]|nr:EpsG family protein [Pseudomonadota bacterium]